MATVLSNREYDEALAILRNERSLHPIFSELKCFIEQQFNVKVSTIQFREVLCLPSDIKRRYRMSIFFMSKEAQRKMLLTTQTFYGNDPYKEKIILGKLRELNKHFSFFQEKELKNLFIFFANLGHDIIVDINCKSIREAEKFIKKKYKELDIWQVDYHLEEVYVFFKTDNQIHDYAIQGLLDRIKEDYLAFVAKYDEFGVYKVNEFLMNFSSKEIIDKEYGGSISWYFRCQ